MYSTHTFTSNLIEYSHTFRPAWIFTLCISTGVLVMTIFAFTLLGHYEEILLKTFRPTTSVVHKGTLFLAQGTNPQKSIDDTLTYLYGEDVDSINISKAVIDSLVTGFFSSDIAYAPLLTSFGDVPFSFLVQGESDGSYEWGFAIASNSVDGSILIPQLHRSFESRFPHAVERTRNLPSGKVMRDIVSSDVAVRSESEEWHEFTIIRSTHEDSNTSFLTAEGHGMIVFANNRELLLSVLRSGMPPGNNALLLHKALFGVLLESLPESDTLRLVHALYTEKEDVLSLSSFRCIP